MKESRGFAVFTTFSRVPQILELRSKLNWEVNQDEIMATLANDVQQSELLDRLVLDFDTTEVVGRVEKLWLDILSHQVKGLTCTHGIFNREKHSFFWHKIVTVGHDSILVKTEDREEVEPELIDNVVRLKVWTDAGNKAGRLVDYCIDTTTGNVTAYLFSSNGWRGIAGGIYTLNPEGVITVGNSGSRCSATALWNKQKICSTRRMCVGKLYSLSR